MTLHSYLPTTWRCASPARKVLGLIIALIGILIVSTPSSVLAHGNGAPFNGIYADDASHSFHSIESTQADYNHWNPFFHEQNDHARYGKTDINLWEKANYASWVDIYWYQASKSEWNPPDAVGDVYCKAFRSNGTCDRWRMRMKWDAQNLSTILEKNLVCHEIGHTLGFNHGSDSSDCMSGGDNNLVSTHMKDHINARY